MPPLVVDGAGPERIIDLTRFIELWQEHLDEFSDSVMLHNHLKSCCFSWRALDVAAEEVETHECSSDSNEPGRGIIRLDGDAVEDPESNQ